MLNTIYRHLTGNRFNPSRYGDHWQDIGFQGSDPATDLRGTGCLGLINILYALDNIESRKIAECIYKLSLHPVQVSTVYYCIY